MRASDYPKDTAVEIAEAKACDFCVSDERITTAIVDGATIYGPWANMCEAHYRQFGLGLGLGVGQRLIVVPA